MRRTLALLFAGLALVAGCRAQQPSAPYYSCPTPGTNYTTLNLATPASGTTYVDVNGTGNQIASSTVCYVAQTLQSTGTSVASNVTMATLSSSNHQVTLNWNPPPSCTAAGAPACTYIVSRIAAAATYPTAPTVGAPAVAENVQKPGQELATLLAPVRLRVVSVR